MGIIKMYQVLVLKRIRIAVTIVQLVMKNLLTIMIINRTVMLQ